MSPPGPPAPLPAPETGPRLALFRAGGRLCGVAAAFCKQFVQLDAVTPVPLAPARLLGVTQLRGRILPVLDAASLLGLAPPPDSGGAAVAGMPALVVTATGLDSALAALTVTEIVGFERPTTPSGGGSGPALWQGEAVTVLDPAAIVAGLRPAAGHARHPAEELRQ
jgi:chemotaxis signal transduction protein